MSNQSNLDRLRPSTFLGYSGWVVATRQEFRAKIFERMDAVYQKWLDAEYRATDLLEDCLEDDPHVRELKTTRYCVYAYFTGDHSGDNYIDLTAAHWKEQHMGWKVWPSQSFLRRFIHNLASDDSDSDDSESDDSDSDNSFPSDSEDIPYLEPQNQEFVKNILRPVGSFIPVALPVALPAIPVLEPIRHIKRHNVRHLEELSASEESDLEPVEPRRSKRVKVPREFYYGY